ncbi:PREDICTED: uncharacterized protein LOC105451271 isoform X2 [Wasmannia auropunctata]|uniref:uncharacterized protein LOC105451271 isoform X2 n=1 Tax=Wasmannia auropunctata TaxID=64793 RepID=UPI0005EF798F|nr:PREDICTED: uncharacterized protein LOC105451271 isoform X2 [Wasmannia auropunctata]
MKQTNHYVSTYQKDYTWPLVSSICIQPPTKPIVVKACMCTDSQQVRKESWDENLEGWSRMCPMGRLLEPKIYPKIERVPPADLEEGYPGLYDVLEKSLPRETTTRADADRMKTTYQVDYSDPAAARTTQRDMALTVIDGNGERVRCSMPIKIMVAADCPSYCRLPSVKYNGNTDVWKQERKIRSKHEKKCENEKRLMSLPSWKSEYHDSISKIGHAIMKAKLHNVKKKIVPLQYQYC